MKRILVIHGPNLNMLGNRERDVYGTETLESLNRDISNRAAALGLEVKIFQSNHEGEILDFIHREFKDAAGIVINPGALTHYSLALRDALKATELTVVEVHLSNIFSREDFRGKSVISPVTKGVITGLGKQSYLLALEYFKS